MLERDVLLHHTPIGNRCVYERAMTSPRRHEPDVLGEHIVPHDQDVGILQSLEPRLGEEHPLGVPREDLLELTVGGRPGVDVVVWVVVDAVERLEDEPDAVDPLPAAASVPPPDAQPGASPLDDVT